jgi:aspartate kinase
VVFLPKFFQDMENIKVFKFGGASIKSAENINNVVSILEKHKTQKLMIIVSALGKTTNQLEQVVNHRSDKDQALKQLEMVKSNHLEIIAALGLGEDTNLLNELNDLLVEIEWSLEEYGAEYDYIYDQIVSVGELLSSKILVAKINQLGVDTQWLDARGVIITDDIYREGWVDWERTTDNIHNKVKPLFNKVQFVLSQGFIGSTMENNTTTLGREGSDYSAAIFSHGLDSSDMTIWKDVPGVLTGDPKLFKNVTKLDSLSYREAIEMTYYGAKVIHPKTIKPLQNKNIPLFVKSFLDPDGDGTLVSDEVLESYPPIITIEDNQAIINISTRDFSFVAEHHLSYLFQEIAKHRLQVNMMQNSAISFSVCVNNIDDRVEKFNNQIQETFKTKVERNLELINIRHYQKDLVERMKMGKIIRLEERKGDMIQLVVKDIPKMERL